MVRNVGLSELHGVATQKTALFKKETSEGKERKIITKIGNVM